MEYVIRLRSADDDPIHSGTMGSWFYFYKWQPGEDVEVFFPIAETALPHIKEGDVLWFTMDGNVVGHVPLLRVVDDDFNDKKELWYNCSQCQVYPYTLRFEGFDDAPHALNEQEVGMLRGARGL